jgi:hypothetical protein
MHKDKQRTSYIFAFFKIKKGTNESLNLSKTHIKWVDNFLFLVQAICMSSLQARIEKHFRLYLKFLGPHDVMMEYLDLLV